MHRSQLCGISGEPSFPLMDWSACCPSQHLLCAWACLHLRPQHMCTPVCLLSLCPTRPGPLVGGRRSTVPPTDMDVCSKSHSASAAQSPGHRLVPPEAEPGSCGECSHRCCVGLWVPPAAWGHSLCGSWCGEVTRTSWCPWSCNGRQCVEEGDWIVARGRGWQAQGRRTTQCRKE